jgi:hypothetical protein
MQGRIPLLALESNMTNRKKTPATAAPAATSSPAELKEFWAGGRYLISPTASTSDLLQDASLLLGVAQSVLWMQIQEFDSNQDISNEHTDVAWSISHHMEMAKSIVDEAVNRILAEAKKKAVTP